MIITCPCNKKEFEVDASLIPTEGKLLQCGACDRKWFFQKEVEIKEKELPIERISIEDKIQEIPKKTEDIIVEAENTKKDIAIKKNIPKVSFLNKLLIIFISFIALIVLLDTFKTQIMIFLPGFDFVLESLYETLKDIFLFISDLFNK
jgi:hypothetical protein|tara:strand:- start:236 stop:679 length:444 start_codon:yes stop_codon:yes gene_type:complete